MNNESLLSIGQLCDEGCVAIFDKYKLYIIRNGKQILLSTWNFDDCLWDAPFKKKDINNINNIISCDKNKTELAQYLHGCAFMPVVSTFQKFINKGKKYWPGIDDLNFKKLIGMIEAALKGHLDQERKKPWRQKTLTWATRHPYFRWCFPRPGIYQN